MISPTKPSSGRYQEIFHCKEISSCRQRALVAVYTTTSISHTETDFGGKQDVDATGATHLKSDRWFINLKQNLGTSNLRNITPGHSVSV